LSINRLALDAWIIILGLAWIGCHGSFNVVLRSNQKLFLCGIVLGVSGLMPLLDFLTMEIDNGSNYSMQNHNNENHGGINIRRFYLLGCFAERAFVINLGIHFRILIRATINSAKCSKFSFSKFNLALLHAKASKANDD